MAGIFLAGVLLCSCSPDRNSDVSIYEIKLNGERNPMGISDARPVFSWKLKSKERNRYQSAYQIIVLSGNAKDT